MLDFSANCGIIKVSKETNVKLDTLEGLKMCNVVELAYCRISRKTQSIERQIRNVSDSYPNAVIFQEAYTGTKVAGRKEFDKLLTLARKEAAAGKTVRIIFDSVSRMSRNAQEGFELYQELFALGIELVFIKEPHINTETYREAMNRQINLDVQCGDDATDELVKGIADAINRYTLRLAEKQILLAFQQSEKEVQDLHQRTSEGILTAKINGKRVGTEQGRKLNVKKANPTKEQIRKYSQDFDGTLPDTDVMKLVGVARNTYYKYKREIRAEQ